MSYPIETYESKSCGTNGQALIETASIGDTGFKARLLQFITEQGHLTRSPHLEFDILDSDDNVAEGFRFGESCEGERVVVSPTETLDISYKRGSTVGNWVFVTYVQCGLTIASTSLHCPFLLTLKLYQRFSVISDRLRKNAPRILYK